MAGRHPPPEAGIRIIGVDHGHPAGAEAGEDAAFFAGDPVHVAHPFEVGPLRVGYHRHGRRAKRRQIGDFARVIHAHLDDRCPMAGIDSQQGQRQTDVVVQIAARRQHGIAKLAPENGGDHFLGRRLAIRARHGDDRDFETGAPRGSHPAEGNPRIGNNQRRCAHRHARLPGHQQGAGTGGDGLLQEIVAIETLATQRHEQLPWFDRARVGGHAGNRLIGTAQDAADGALDLGEPPVHHATTRGHSRRKASAVRA